jgi:hypothetical protein
MFMENSPPVLRALPSERGVEKEVVNTCVRQLLSVAVTGREGFHGNRNQQNSLSTMEPGKVEIGAEILLRISREFGKSIEWLLTGQGLASMSLERRCFLLFARSLASL